MKRGGGGGWTTTFVISKIWFVAEILRCGKFYKRKTTTNKPSRTKSMSVA